jgi:hypothetical protein
MGDINFESSQFACETAKNSSDDRNVISQVASTGQNIVTIPAKSSIKLA